MTRRDLHCLTTDVVLFVADKKCPQLWYGHSCDKVTVITVLITPVHYSLRSHSCDLSVSLSQC